jgi:hypothetical protein
MLNSIHLKNLKVPKRISLLRKNSHFSGGYPNYRCDQDGEPPLNNSTLNNAKPVPSLKVVSGSFVKYHLSLVKQLPGILYMAENDKIRHQKDLGDRK